jgi:hypothetical protein
LPSRGHPNRRIHTPELEGTAAPTAGDTDTATPVTPPDGGVVNFSVLVPYDAAGIYARLL